MQKITVLTGDIVASSALNQQQLDRAMETLDLATRSLSDWSKGNCDMLTGFARRGGDGWQSVLGDPSLDLRAALFYRASLMAAGPFQTRVAVATDHGALGTAERIDPNHGYGPAFTRSGRLLEKLPRNILMKCDNGGARDAAFVLADFISREWTQAQATAMALALAPTRRTQKDMADHLGISRQAVAQALQAAGNHALKAALDLVEAEAAEGRFDD